MTNKKLLVVAAVLVMVLGTAGIAGAITNGQPDGDDHPYVALLVFGWDTPGGFVPGWRCSGALIAEDLILTAGHCTHGADTAVVWFDTGPIPNGTWLEPGNENPTCAGESDYPCTGDVTGTPYTNPDYYAASPYGGGNGLPAFSYRDVGVVVLDELVDDIALAELPTAGVVDTLKNKADVDLVGYGVQYQAQIPGVFLPKVPPPPYWRWTGPKTRMYAPSQLVSGKFVFSPEYMRLSMNPGGGKGGSCFGDSGGPDLQGGTDTVLAVNSFVTNVNCSGVGYSSRVDIPEILDWINGFLP